MDFGLVMFSSNSSLLCLCHWTNTIYIINEVMYELWASFIYVVGLAPYM